ncbi:MAG: substrate-binding domain-containing protein [Bacteroidota bacterium]
MKKTDVLVLLVLSFLLGCAGEPVESPTAGSVRIAADETLFPMTDALEGGFEHTYKNASVEISYLPEAAAFRQLLADSVRFIVAARQLSPQEIAHFEKEKRVPRTSKIATDAIALVVHPSNPDSQLTCQEALKIFSGEIARWEKLNPKNAGGDIRLVFDNSGSSTVGYVLKKSGLASPPANSYALKTNEAVVEYVAQNPGALGIIGYNWASDYDDPLARKLRSQAKIAAVSPCEGDSTGQFYKPFADNLLRGLYPFSREVFVINVEGKSGLASGFAAYIAGEIGQRIILKAGILPAYKVEHNIELKSEPFRVEK